MIAYPPGHEPDFWSPDPEERTHRFALGNTSRASADDPPLIAICMNPSYADHSEADKTVNRLIQASLDNAHPGWVMLNLYPERATDASKLLDYDPVRSTANCEAIERVLSQYEVTEVLVAWGGLKHPTLRLAKRDVLDTLDRLAVKPFTFDGLTTGGDPFHPTPRGPALLMKGAKRYLVRVGNRFVEQVP
ncbi:DUF1643 domain-containing protein [Microbacterium oleivorans]|uniref:DUF1643 domain-containing protein n=1 Tax=Microbacterium oleivorans TaxID=273677 RepID=UPI0010A3A805|nr:DUF1643 domain-containing protein [Microbacterium oleivorans]THE07810.1 DUF1643 domain-containing protein [Microbacterium oleivorans]